MGLLSPIDTQSKRKQFFFEKKNQKTFIRCRATVLTGWRQRLNVFCFFSSEKKTLLP
jgi:hypothetical protein